MSSRGKPRQPRTTQENKDGTLRYEHETNTWQCARCGKNYSGQNARSAQSHAAAHTRAEKKQREEQEANIIQHYTHQNQDKVRIRTLGNYGSEHRGRESGESQKNDEETSSTSRSQNDQNTGKERGRKPQQTDVETQQTQQPQHSETQEDEETKMRRLREEGTGKHRENKIETAKKTMRRTEQ